MGCVGTDSGECVLFQEISSPIVDNNTNNNNNDKIASSSVSFISEVLSIVQVTKEDNGLEDDKTVVEYRMFTLWDPDVLTKLPYYSIIMDEDGDKKVLSNIICDLNFNEELTARNCKVSRVSQLKIEANVSELIITDICLLNDSVETNIDWRNDDDQINVIRIPIKPSDSIRIVNLYEIQDADAQNPVEYRLVFELYDGLND